MNERIGALFRSSAIQRLARGIAAQGYGHLVAIGLQLASVPILISAWGEARYGSWLLLSALTTYLTLSDLGFAQAATNDMTVSMANGRSDDAKQTFHSLLALCACIGGVVILLATSLASAFSLTSVLNLRDVTEFEAKAVTLALAGQVALAILNGGLTGALRADGRFATMSVIGNSARLAEGVTSLTVALLGGGVVGAALAMLVVRLISVTAVYILLRRGTAVFWASFSHARPQELRRLVGPSLSYLAFPLGNALMIQGALTLVGLRIPGAVALFATSRTLTRLGATVLGSVNHVFLFDYGRTLGKGDRAGFFRLLRVNGMLIGCGLVLYVIAMVVVGPAFYERWTHGRLSLNLALLSSLIAVSLAETIWAFAQTPLFSINCHFRVAISYLIGAAATLGIGTIALGRGLGLEMFVCLQAGMYVVLTCFVLIDLYRRLQAPRLQKYPAAKT